MAREGYSWQPGMTVHEYRDAVHSRVLAVRRRAEAKGNSTLMLTMLTSISASLQLSEDRGAIELLEKTVISMERILSGL